MKTLSRCVGAGLLAAIPMTALSQADQETEALDFLFSEDAPSCANRSAVTGSSRAA